MAGSEENNKMGFFDWGPMHSPTTLFSALMAEDFNSRPFSQLLSMDSPLIQEQKLKPSSPTSFNIRSKSIDQVDPFNVSGGIITTTQATTSTATTNPGSAGLGGFGQAQKPPARGGLSERLAARGGFNAPRLNTARFKSLSTLSSPNGVRSPYLTIPPGLSPTTLLDSPVLLSNSQVEQSPTTGTFPLPPLFYESGVPSPSNSGSDGLKEKGNENGDSGSFAFKPYVKSGSSSCLSPLGGGLAAFCPSQQQALAGFQSQAESLSRFDNSQYQAQGLAQSQCQSHVQGHFQPYAQAQTEAYIQADAPTQNQAHAQGDVRAETKAHPQAYAQAESQPQVQAQGHFQAQALAQLWVQATPISTRIRAMKIQPILRGFVLGCVIRLCEASFFVLPSTWTVVNNSSLPIYRTEQGPFRVVTDGEGNAIMSEDYRFGFGFINVNSSGQFILSIVLGVNFTSSDLRTEIWTANRQRTVAEGAVLSLGSSGNMVLEDSDGTVAWNISTGKTQNKAIAMQITGNLQIYNTANSSLASSSSLVWQSWDHPTDTLLPGQVLKTGYTLVSNVSATKASQGSYKLVMEPGGMVLFYRSKFEEPYWSLGLPGLDYEGILRPCFYTSSSQNSEGLYTGTELQVSFNETIGNSSTSCSNGTSVLYLAPHLNDTQYRFMRLENDGNFRAFMVPDAPGPSNTSSMWTPDFEIDQSDKCVLPRVCGPYSICAKGQCSCPGSGTADNFDQIQNLDVTQGCYSRSGEPDCTQTSVGHHFLLVDEADYYLNEFFQPLRNVSTIDNCKSLCTSNCSCTAAFFHNSSASCYLATGPLNTMKSKSNQTYKAYIKVQNNMPLNQTSASGSLSTGSVAGITVGSAAAALFLFLIIIVTIQHMRKSKANGDDISEEEIDPEEMEEEAFLKTLPGLPPRFTYHELKEATDNFTKKLGTGGFGSVYEGILKDNSRVAVKKLDGLRQGYKEFRAEVATIGSISHLNLVRLRGFCADRKQRLLVYELLENRSLDKWLFPPRTGSQGSPNSDENSNVFLTWEQRYNVAIGTARGLVYLHEECREPIMHLDIKPQNILLDKNFLPKVADFGMSKLLNEDMTQIVTAVRGTPGYLAPEWLTLSIATKKCDVYSFGMVILELVSGRRNFDPFASDPRLCYFPAWAMLRALEGRYLDLADKRLENNVDREAVIRMTKVAFWCIQDNPDKRPWMSVALKMLEGEWDIPDAPLWLVQRGPQFLEGYGYEPMERDKQDSSFGNVGTNDSIATVSSTELSGPR